ncbi:MAG: M14 metallopeptidase family protein [Bacteroidota bacterium]
MRLLSRLLILCICTSAGGGFFGLTESMTLAAQVPSPDRFLPHALGEHFTPHHLLVDYFEAVAEASPKVVLEEYGRTYEQRPLLLSFVSSPENLAQLEAIRLNNLRRIGLAEGEVDPDLDVAIVWLGYTVHGNEAAGSEAALGVLYDLVTESDAAEWLENTVVVIDPCQNPDGFSRYAHWYRSIAPLTPNPDVSTIEHREPWPNGRVNHYLFDLNRDWAWQTQIESQQRMRIYHRWMPHVYADLHEMGYTDPYFFAPAAAPFHEFITPFQREFQYDIGRNHIARFDRQGWLYYTREVFDLFYPSYGDTYTTFNGAVGMTYEQGGSGRGGRSVELPTDDELTLADRVSHHRETSLSTVEVASREADRLLSNFEQYFKDAAQNPPGEYRTYVISADNDAGDLEALKLLLRRNDIRFGLAETGFSLSAFSYKTGESVNYRGQAGDLIVSAFQARAVLTQILFDPEAELEDSLTYDITAWALPYAYGLDAYASTSLISASVEDISLDPPPPPAMHDPQEGPSDAFRQAYAVGIPWQGLPTASFLGRALSVGLHPRKATEACTISGQSFSAGSIFFTRADNRSVADFHELLFDVLKTSQHEFELLSSGFADEGPDLGSDSYELVSQPVVATLYGSSASPNEMGQVWHFFERDLGYPLQLQPADDLSEVDLEGVDVFILPEGYYGFDSATADRFTSWIRSGGRLIAIGRANDALARSDAFALTAKEQEDSDPLPRLRPYGDQDREWITGFVPGAIVELEIDNTHPLATGMESTYFALKTSGSAFKYLDGGWNVGRLAESTPVSGFMGQAAQDRLEGTLSYGVENMGRGQVVYLVDNPLFRSFWYSGKHLMVNALFQL